MLLLSAGPALTSLGGLGAVTKIIVRGLSIDRTIKQFGKCMAQWLGRLP